MLRETTSVERKLCTLLDRTSLQGQSCHSLARAEQGLKQSQASRSQEPREGNWNSRQTGRTEITQVLYRSSFSA